MNRFVQKIIEFLLKRTEHLNGAVNSSADPNDPMQQRMKTLLEKRELMKQAVKQAADAKGDAKNAAPKSTTLSGTIADSLAAKKSAITPPKKAQNAKKNNRPRRGR